MELSLGTHYKEFISIAIKSGRYSSVNDVIRKSILLLEIEENRVNVLRNKLSAGENSPMLNDFDAQDFLKQIHNKYL